MCKEKIMQIIEEIKQKKFSDIDTVVFDKDGSYVMVSGKDFQQLMSKN